MDLKFCSLTRFHYHLAKWSWLTHQCFLMDFVVIVFWKSLLPQATIPDRSAWAMSPSSPTCSRSILTQRTPLFFLSVVGGESIDISTPLSAMTMMIMMCLLSQSLSPQVTFEICWNPCCFFCSWCFASCSPGMPSFVLTCRPTSSDWQPASLSPWCCARCPVTSRRDLWPSLPKTQ